MGSAFWPIGKPEILHSRSGCHDGPCSFLGRADPPLRGYLAPEDPACEVHQATNPVSSALNYPPGFDFQSKELRVNTNSGLSLHRHTLPERSGANVSARGLIQRSSLSLSLSYPSKV